jgi:hypothetical protein
MRGQCWESWSVVHIRSAILNTSQPRAAKPTPHRTITATIAFLFFLQDNYDFTMR